MTEVVARRAGLRELLPLSWGSAEAFCRHRPRWARVLLPVSWLLRVPSFVGWISAGEVWATGRATSVVMTPGKGIRSKLLTAGTLVLTFAVLLAVFLVAASLPGVVGLWAVGLLGLLLLVFALAALLEATWLISGTHRAQGERDARRQPNPVLLHDLARGTSDATASGIGVALLGAMLRHSAYQHATIIAIAATEQLAGRYCAEGMTPIRPGSHALIRPARDDV